MKKALIITLCLLALITTTACIESSYSTCMRDCEEIYAGVHRVYMNETGNPGCLLAGCVTQPTIEGQKLCLDKCAGVKP